jgi:hypothetical protein
MRSVSLTFQMEQPSHSDLKLRKSVSKKGTRATKQYEAEGRAICEKTEQLRAPRIAKEAAEAVGNVPASRPTSTPLRTKPARHRRWRDVRVQSRARIAKQRWRWRMCLSFRVSPRCAPEQPGTIDPALILPTSRPGTHLYRVRNTQHRGDVQAGAAKLPGLFEVPRHCGVRSLLALYNARRTPSASKSLV